MIQINLLPGAAKRKQRQALLKALTVVVGLFGLSIIGFGIVLSLLLGSKAQVQAKINDLDQQIASTEETIRSYTSVIEQTTLLNSRLQTINGLLSKVNHWSQFLLDFAQATPADGVRYVTMGIGSDGTLSVTGIADSSVVLERLLNSLEAGYATTVVPGESVDSLAALVREHQVTEEALYEVNRVENETDLLAKESIVIPSELFSSVELTSVSLDTEDPSAREVDKNVIFAIQLTISGFVQEARR